MPKSWPTSFFSSGAVRMGLAISIATGLYGISFGALSVAAGLNLVQTQLLSALMFTGGSQFAFIGTLAGGGGAAVLAASLLGVRNAVYGTQLNASLRPRFCVAPVMAHLSIDESFATAISQASPNERRRGFWTAGIGVWVTWNFFTFLGAWAGTALGDPKQWGLDGAASAAFLGLLWPRLRRLDAVAVAILSAVVVTALAPFLSPGIPLLIGGVVAVLVNVIATRTRKVPNQASNVGPSAEAGQHPASQATSDTDKSEQIGKQQVRVEASRTHINPCSEEQS